MNCPLLSEETTDLLIEYSAGRLDVARRTLLERHMAVCANCAAFQTEQTELWKALDAWEPEPVSVDFNRHIWRRMDAIAEEPWYRRLADGLRFGAWKPVFPLAAAVLVVAAGFVLDNQRTVTTPDSTGTNGLSVTEADQIERTLDDIQLLHQFDSVPPAGAASSKPM